MAAVRRSERIVQFGVLLVLVCIGLAIGMPGSDVANPSGDSGGIRPLCVRGEYVITRSSVPVLDDKKIGTIEKVGEGHFRKRQESATAFLIRDVAAPIDANSLNEESPSALDGSELVSPAQATLCDSLRKQAREIRRGNAALAKEGRAALPPRRIECSCNSLVYADETRPSDPMYSVGSPITNMESAWDITTGDPSTVIAVIDSGVDVKHPDLLSNIWRNPEEVAGDHVDNDLNGYVDDVHGANLIKNTGYPIDENGHGTHVAGIIAAAANNGEGSVGVMWRASILPLKILDANGTGTLMDVVKAVDYVNLMKSRGVNIVVANYSLSTPAHDLSFERALQRSSDAGMAAAVAAGNNGRDNTKYPCYPANFTISGLLSVGAVDSTGSLTPFSNYSISKVHIGAPGANVLSTYPSALGSYATLSGTSMASPYVAGVMGLISSIAPMSSPGELASAVVAGGRPRGLQTISGKALDAYQALLQAEPQTLTVTGSVSDESGSPVPGTYVIFTDGSATVSVMTDSTGGFEQRVKAGTYQVRPSKTGYSFTPESRVVSVSDQSVSSIDFVGTKAALYEIGGKVEVSEYPAGAGGVLVELTRDRALVATVTTEASGAFTFPSKLPAGTYSVEPSKESFKFSPFSQTITLSSDTKDLAFAGGLRFPIFEQRPEDVTVSEGETAIFSAKVIGRQVTYRWGDGRYGAQPLSTSSELVLPNVDVSKHKTQYYLSVNGDSSLGGRAFIQAIATLKVVPKLSGDLQDVRVKQGEPAAFTAESSGSGLSYRWFVNGVSNACASARCSIDTSKLLGDMPVYVEIRNSAGGLTTSRTATLTVLPFPPEITSITPNNPVIREGFGRSLVVSAQGPSLAYSWEKNGIPIPSQTRDSLTVSNLQATDSGVTYTAVVSNQHGTARASTVFTVKAPPVITSVAPPNPTVKEGRSITFSVAATGTDLTYAWRINGIPVPRGTGPSLTLEGVAKSLNDALVEVDVKDGAGEITGSAGRLRVQSPTPPGIVEHPTNVAASVGATASFRVVQNGGASLQWYKNNTPIPGATSQVYTTPPLGIEDSGAQFLVEVSNEDGVVRSTAATLTVNYQPLRIVAPLPNPSVTTGETVSLEVRAEGFQLSYAWYKNDSLIPGSNGSRITFTANAADHNATVRVDVTDARGEKVSASTTLSVREGLRAPRITAPLVSGVLNVTEGGSLSIPVVVSELHTRKVWYKDGAPLSENHFSWNGLAYEKIATVQDRGAYFLRVWRDSTYRDSKLIVVRVAPRRLKVSELPKSAKGRVGKILSLSVSAQSNFTSPIQYQWYKNSVPIPNATGPILKYKVQAKDKKVKFSVRATAMGIEAKSNATALVLTK